MESTSPKNPARVRAGQARMAQLRQELAAAGQTLANHQRNLYEKTLANHPDWHQRGGKAAYQVLVQRYGVEYARNLIRQAHESNRLRRLSHPTAGEQTLRFLLAQHGIRVSFWTTRHDYLTDAAAFAAVGMYEALAEGVVGPYACDVLVPHQHVAIEVYGGVHRICQEHDAKRRVFLESHGLTVVELTNDQVLATPATVLTHLRTVLDFPAHRGGPTHAEMAECVGGGTQ
ncbi:MAG: DUF559 domain-containing protein [Blastochloris sp.]|nr:DUF559 domain-containing protein [Blastochloris sp.]